MPQGIRDPSKPLPYKGLRVLWCYPVVFGACGLGLDRVKVGKNEHAESLVNRKRPPGHKIAPVTPIGGSVPLHGEK